MNKRSFSRIHFQTEAVVQFQEKSIRGEVSNLSLNGAFIQTMQIIPLGENVDVRILLSGTSSELSVNVKGIVVRQDEAGLGIRFTGMDLDSFMHIKNIIAYNSEDASEAEREFERFLRGKDDF